LNQKTGGNYRLPTEAEWEYAARGGQKKKDTKFAGSDNLDEVGWWKNNSGGKTHPVGQKKTNELGIHDMSGNVWEWCADHWHVNYNGVPTDGSAWVSGGDSARRVVRGGAWLNDLSRILRASYRGLYFTADRFGGLGFR
ncbi:SUMF1/EgtB/PvdO family nonheme iron enzyme, partial [Arthrospira platensis SPKY1]|nr:SUMF1/EgtB/PvdO family nonheme iron enzyme [Arthrospira platensis SPKY1]